MLKYLETKSSILNENTFSDKFTDKRVLVMGSGPSVNSVNWEKLEYDVIVTTTFFYLNDKVRNLKNITHITLSEIIDFNHPDLIKFIQSNPECTLALEPKPGRPFYNTDTFKQFENTYKDKLIYYNTEVDRLEGVGGRLAFFVMAFNPKELYYVGIDGKSQDQHKNDPYNAFRKNIKDGDDLEGGKSNLSPKHARHSYEKVLNDHINFAQVLHNHSKSSNTKLYNLGEGFPYNCSTVYSKQHFPLPEQIKQKIKKNGNK